jgi:hypothetical protein
MAIGSGVFKKMAVFRRSPLLPQQVGRGNAAGVLAQSEIADARGAPRAFVPAAVTRGMLASTAVPTLMSH